MSWKTRLILIAMVIVTIAIYLAIDKIIIVLKDLGIFLVIVVPFYFGMTYWIKSSWRKKHERTDTRVED